MPIFVFAEIVAVEAVLLVAVSFFAGVGLENRAWEAEMIRLGLAQYNPKTGKWEWVGPGKIWDEN